MNPDRSMESDYNEDNNESNVVALAVSNDAKTLRSCRRSTFCENVVRNVSLDHASVQPYAQRVAQVVPSQLGKRRCLQFETTQVKAVENDHVSQNPSDILDSCADTPSTHHDTQLTGSTHSKCPLSLSQNANLTSKPSGIGLHLNSIVNAIPVAKRSTKLTEGSVKKSISVGSHMQDNVQSPLISSNLNLVENVFAINEEYTHETPSADATSMEVIEHLEKYDQGSFNCERAEKIEKLDRSNPKKKRKKMERTVDGCKHCNCKKSKCLKLYCDCFAAGIYCADPCSCEGCFNRPEYENTVLETRQQIESRNPLAFAPKIIRRLTQPRRSQPEDGDQLMPLAGRHKRGCNCKKSMCLKKYCECYQENVGCSDGCRCEGCQNIYGMKGGSSVVREMGMEASNGKLNDSYDDKFNVGSIRPVSSLLEIPKPDNLTPQTPSFQCSNHGEDASKARDILGGYIPSPESECALYTPYVTTPQSLITETSNKNCKMVPFDEESRSSMDFMDEILPSCTTTSMKEWSNDSRTQVLPPSGVGFSNHCFRGSLFTPVTLVGGAKLSDSHKKSVDIIDDDTPKILRDFSIEPGKVKVSSPNKKRISPPRIRLHELGLGSLKSGRKFILKAIPSLPPVTPCIDSKDNTGQKYNDHQHDNTL